VLDAAKSGDIVVVTIPLKHIGSVPVEPTTTIRSATDTSRSSTTSPRRRRSSFRLTFRSRRW
jgi:hypothetical protein